MSKDAIKEFNTWHTNRPVDTETNTPWHNFVKKYIKELDLSGKKILEIGCGRGGFSCWLAERAKESYQELVAADFSEAEINKAMEFSQSKGFERLSWQVQDIQKISFPDNYFDIVISCETIEHVPNPQLAVKELSRVVKPNGIVFLTTPNYLGFFGLYRFYLRLTGRKWTEVGQPINQFVMLPKTLLWLKRAGLATLFYDSSIISMPFPGKRKVIHFKENWPRFLLKWFGLQSFFIAKK